MIIKAWKRLILVLVLILLGTSILWGVLGGKVGATGFYLSTLSLLIIGLGPLLGLGSYKASRFVAIRFVKPKWADLIGVLSSIGCLLGLITLGIKVLDHLF
jgi:hypothetical protein